MTLVLGVDGGNSKTLAVVADHTGTVLGVGRSGSGSHQALGLDASMREIRTAAEAAVRMAAVEVEGIDGAFFALAGADLAEDFALLEPAVAALGLAPRTKVDNDSLAGLRAGTDSLDAVVVILGAGTNGRGQNRRGETVQLPGLGWISGDWGGGGALSREAISLSMRMWDGRGESTFLQDMVLHQLQMPSMQALLEALYTGKFERTQLFTLAPLVFRAADMGDGPAQALIERSAQEVAVTAVALLKRLDLLAVPADVVLAGSVFRDPSALLIDGIRARLAVAAPMANIIVPVLEPVLGSVLCAMEMLDLSRGETVRARLAETYILPNGKRLGKEAVK